MAKRISVFLLICMAAAVVAFVPLPTSLAAPTERTFRIEASQFAYSPAELQVNPGDEVTIELASTDVVHGLYIDGYGVSVTSDPGQTNRLTFTANQPGTFRMRCNVTCGAMHPFMIGKLHVGQNMLLWRGIGLGVVAVCAVMASFYFSRIK